MKRVATAFQYLSRIEERTKLLLMGSEAEAVLLSTCLSDAVTDGLAPSLTRVVSAAEALFSFRQLLTLSEGVGES